MSALDKADRDMVPVEDEHAVDGGVDDPVPEGEDYPRGDIAAGITGVMQEDRERGEDRGRPQDYGPGLAYLPSYFDAASPGTSSPSGIPRARARAWRSAVRFITALCHQGHGSRRRSSVSEAI